MVAHLQHGSLEAIVHQLGVVLFLLELLLQLSDTSLQPPLLLQRQSAETQRERDFFFINTSHPT